MDALRSQVLCAWLCFAVAAALMGLVAGDTKPYIALAGCAVIVAALLDRRLAWTLFFTAAASTGISLTYANATIRPELLAAPLLFAAVRRPVGKPAARARVDLARAWSYACLVGLLAIGAYTSVFVARLPPASLWVFVQLTFSIFCMVWLRRAGSDRVQMVVVGSVVMTAISLLGVAAWVLAHDGGGGTLSFALSGDGRVRGLSIEPNIFASQSLGWLGVMYARRHDLSRNVLLTSVPVVGALLLAGTRAAWLGLAFMALVMVIRTFRRPGLFVGSLVSGLIASIVGAQVIADSSASGASLSANPVLWRVAHLFDTTSGTGAYRVDTVRLALQDIGASHRWLFGDGMNSYRQHHLLDITKVGPAYLGSLWYELLYDVGLLGLVCFVGFLVLNFLSAPNRLDMLPLYAGLLICATATNIVWLAFMWIYFALAEAVAPAPQQLWIPTSVDAHGRVRHRPPSSAGLTV
jgi:hypothetical protein